MAIFKDVPIQSDLWKMFTYHSDGYLIWKIKTAKHINTGDRAGTVDKDGYVKIQISCIK